MAGMIDDNSQISDVAAYRFWAQVDKSGDCWEWQGRKGPQGYGAFSVKGISRVAHRVAYVLTYGSIPANKILLHECDNRGCVNPLHLMPGSHEENALDKALKGRSTRGQRFH